MQRQRCVKIGYVCVCVSVCLCVCDRVVRESAVGESACVSVCVCDEDGRAMAETERYLAATCLDQTREDTNRSVNIRSWEPSVGPKHTRAHHPASPGNQVTDKIASICWVEERQQKHVQPATGDIKLTKLLCNLATFSHGMSGLSNQI